MIGIFRYKDRGPTSSKEYNERVRDTADSYLDLLGRVAAAEAEVIALSTLTAVEHAAVSSLSESLAASIETVQEERDAAILGVNKKVCTVFESRNVLDVDMNGDPIASPLAWESDAGMIVLPHSPRTSKIGFASQGGAWVIHPEVQTNYTFTKETFLANEASKAIDHNKGTAFLVRTDGETVGDNTLTFYISIPNESASGSLVNYIELEPAPRGALTLVGLQYATKPGATLDESDSTQWNDLWVNGDTVTDATKRYRAPQSNVVSTVQPDCGPRRYYFGERRITAIKVVLSATDAFEIGDDGTEYFVGLRHLDVGHVTFSSSGHRVFEYSMPAGTKTISAAVARLVNRSTEDGVDGVGADLPSLSLYYKSGESWLPYVIGTSIGAGITDIRIDATAVMAPNGCTPVLTGFDITYLKS